MLCSLYTCFGCTAIITILTLDVSKKHFIGIRVCIFICAFIYIDSYVIPLKDSVEIIKDKHYFQSRISSKSKRSETFYIETTKRKFDATKSFYLFTAISDTVILHSSPITGSIQKISVVRGNDLYIFEIGSVRVSVAIIFVPILLITLILFHIFYFSIKWPPGRVNLFVATVIGTLLVFFFHLGIVFK